MLVIFLICYIEERKHLISKIVFLQLCILSYINSRSIYYYVILGFRKDKEEGQQHEKCKLASQLGAYLITIERPCRNAMEISLKEVLILFQQLSPHCHHPQIYRTNQLIVRLTQKISKYIHILKCYNARKYEDQHKTNSKLNIFHAFT